jgi:hypothetical protein
MVGRQLWKKSITGLETGRAIITAYISGTQVTCNVLSDFDSTTTIAAGNWFLTTNSISGLWYLEGETVAVVTDGGQHASQVVTGGVINLQYDASVVQVGKLYLGMVKSMDIQAQTQGGPTQSKPKNINRIGIHFLNTLGAKFGSNLYNLDEVEFRSVNDYTGRPSPLFTGTKRLAFEDSTEVEKHVYVIQDKPLPCTILGVTSYIDVDVE